MPGNAISSLEGVDEPIEESPVERTIRRSFEDNQEFGRPLSRRTRQTKRSAESYLRGGHLPRYIARQREIERATDAHRRGIEMAYRALHDECGADRAAFARLWRERAAA